jgi:pyrimidine-nucleoside phosphorylase
VGNAIEIKEAIHTLQGNGPPDFTEHCLEVAAHMLNLTDKASTVEEGREIVEKVYWAGLALDKFKQLVEAQGGDMSYVENPEKLPKATIIETVSAPRSGYLSQVHARVVGEMAVVLGAGRSKKGQAVKHEVGIEVHHKVGDFLEAGEPLFTVHADAQELLEIVRPELLKAHQWSDQAVEPLPLFYEAVVDRD